MPMIELLIARERPVSREAKAAFAREAERILREEIGTPPGRLRLFVIELPAENGAEALLRPAPGGDDGSGGP